MTRVAGIDPGTVSFDLCVLQDGVREREAVFPVHGAVAAAPILAALRDHGPFDLVYGPSGYGIPLRAARELRDADLAEMVLVRADEAHAPVGIGGLRTLVRDLAAGEPPIVFGPGVVHLPTVPAHRKRNRIDLGTADKVCAAAAAIEDQAGRLARPPTRTSFVMLELGGAFAGALAVHDGAIVDGLGGSSGPVGARAAGALDGELAYLLGPALSKQTLFSGGALDPRGEGGLDYAALWEDPERAEDWAALVESALKAVRALTVSLPEPPREVLVSGRLARVAGLVTALETGLADLAPVRALVPGRASSAARGAALIADGLLPGGHRTSRELVAGLRIAEARGSALDGLRVAGAETIRLG